MKISHGHFNVLNPLTDPRSQQVSLQEPFVTIIVTNYNYEKFIIPCLQSIAAQTYTRYKCVVVDDCSSDRSVELINAFIRSDRSGRFSLVCRSENGGQMAAFKTGIQHAEGVFVSFIDADDILFDNFIAAHVTAHLGQHPVAFTSSNQYQINDMDEITAGVHADLGVLKRQRYIKARPLHTPFWIWATTSSMMFRKAVLENIMPDNCDDFRICADNFICHFANLIGGSLLLSDVYGAYRRHGSNSFSSNPVVGGQLPTGDMQQHPKHHIVRLSILSHVLKHHERFLKLLSPERFLGILLLLTGPWEILRMKHKYPAYFNSGRNFPYIRFCMLAIAMRFQSLFRNYLKVLRYVLSDHHRCDPKL